MKIDKILNNNVVIVIDDDHNEAIVMGRGLGFQKKKGDIVDAKLIEKRFSPDLTDNISQRMIDLLSEIPTEVITTAEIIINYAKTELNSTLQNSIYIALIDHINFAIERHKQGFDLPNNLLWEIKQFYPAEYKIGCYAVEKITQRLGVNLPEDEVGFIAFHFVNAQLNDTMTTIYSMTKIMREILNIVKYHFKFEYDENSYAYQRIITHLKFFAQRILNNNFITSKDQALFSLVKQQYPETFKCVEKINTHLTQYYTHPLTDEEQLYLIIHIERLHNELLS